MITTLAHQLCIMTTSMQTMMVLFRIYLTILFLSCPRYDTGLTADQVWDKFNKPLSDAVQLSVSTKLAVRGSSVKKSKWRPRHIRRALNKKRHLWRLHRNSKSLPGTVCICKKIDL